MNSSHRIVEIWTRADVASRLGKWSVAEELWTKIREFYSCHGEIPGSREFVEECDVQINRAQKYGSLSAQRHDPRTLPAATAREAEQTCQLQNFPGTMGAGEQVYGYALPV